MKLKLITLIAVISCIGLAKANLLYWQLTSPADVYDNHWDTSPTSTAFAYAEIIDVTSGAAWNSVADNSAVTAQYIDAGVLAAADIGTSYSGNFYIRLYDASDNMIAWSEEVSYSSVSSAISTAAFNSNWSSMQALTNASFKFVPEPTSGLLMLVGAALLGLRRKRIA